MIRRTLIVPASAVMILWVGGCDRPASNEVGDLTASEAVAAPERFDDAARAYAAGVELHGQRRVGEASRLYRRALDLDPVSDPTEAEIDLAIRHAPLLFVHRDEPLPLEDVGVVLDPDGQRIAYHLFWDDDIDFPDDNEPTDHEVVWITYDPGTDRPTRLQTYFHGEIVDHDLSVEGRPEVFVEWGKHGSLPRAIVGGAAAPTELRENWAALVQGTRRAGHPLAAGWPEAFVGDLDDYRGNAEVVDPGQLIRERRMVATSRWSNAVIDQRFLRYNFSAKPGWP